MYLQDVVIQLGHRCRWLRGNNVSRETELPTVIDCLTRLFLLKICALSSRQPKLFFLEIVSIARGKFRKPLDDRNLTPNRGQSIIFYKLGRTYIRIDVKFPRHYFQDEIHFNEASTILSLMSISKKVNSRCSE